MLSDQTLPDLRSQLKQLYAKRREAQRRILELTTEIRHSRPKASLLAPRKAPEDPVSFPHASR